MYCSEMRGVEPIPDYERGCRYRVLSYVPPGSSGELRFSFNQLPKSSGVYEARYHRDNTFEVLASQPFQVVDTDSDVEYDAQANVTPLLSPTAVRSATPPSPLPKKRS